MKNKNRILLTATAVFLAAAMILLFYSNVRFIGLLIDRHWIIEEGTCRWTTSLVDDYNMVIQKTKMFTSEGDYQQWLVSSGNTYTGKFLRIVVMMVELRVLHQSCRVIYWSLKWQIRTLTSWLSNLKRAIIKKIIRWLRRKIRRIACR